LAFDEYGRAQTTEVEKREIKTALYRDGLSRLDAIFCPSVDEVAPVFKQRRVGRNGGRSNILILLFPVDLVFAGILYRVERAGKESGACRGG
jgi:hypothetical protein